MIWYLICEVISLIMFSEDYSLAQKRGETLLIPTENTETCWGNKRQVQTASLQRPWIWQPRWHTWLRAPSAGPRLHCTSRAQPTRQGQTSLIFSVQKAAPILPSAYLWISSALATETPRWSFSIFVLYFQVTKDSVFSLKNDFLVTISLKIPSLGLS